MTRSTSSAARSTRSSTSAARLAPGAEHVGGDDLRVRGVRAADADPDAVEVRRPEVALERLQSVVARQPAAEPRADVAERQVDLVVDDDEVVEVQLVGAARRARRAARLVHEGLRQQHRDARAADAARPSASSPANFFLGCRDPSGAAARARRGSRRCAGSSRSEGPGFPSPTISQSTGAERRSAPATRRRTSRPSPPSAAASPSPSAPRPRPRRRPRSPSRSRPRPAQASAG